MYDGILGIVMHIVNIENKVIMILETVHFYKVGIAVFGCPISSKLP